MVTRGTLRQPVPQFLSTPTVRSVQKSTPSNQLPHGQQLGAGLFSMTAQVTRRRSLMRKATTAYEGERRENDSDLDDAQKTESNFSCQ